MVLDKHPVYSGMEFLTVNTFRIEHEKSKQKSWESVRTVEIVRLKEKAIIFIRSETFIS